MSSLRVALKMSMEKSVAGVAPLSASKDKEEGAGNAGKRKRALSTSVKEEDMDGSGDEEGDEEDEMPRATESQAFELLGALVARRRKRKKKLEESNNAAATSSSSAAHGSAAANEEHDAVVETVTSMVEEIARMGESKLEPFIKEEIIDSYVGDALESIESATIPLETVALKEELAEGQQADESENLMPALKDESNSEEGLQNKVEVKAENISEVIGDVVTEEAVAMVEREDSLAEEEEPEVEAKPKPKGKKMSRVRRLLLEGGVLDDPSNTSSTTGAGEGARYQSSRAAALVAKTKLKQRGSGSGIRTSESEEGSIAAAAASEAALRVVPLKRASSALSAVSSDKQQQVEGMEEGEEAEDEDESKAEWVQCDDCSVWRKLPSEVDAASLPDTWTCALATWSVANPLSCKPAASITSPEEDASLSKEEGAGSQVVAVEAGVRGSEGKSSSAKKTKGIGGKKPSKLHLQRQSSADTQMLPGETSELSTLLSSTDGTIKKRNPRASSALPTTSSSSIASFEAESVLQQLPPTKVENISWVECDLCHKWRKVSPSVNADTLPETWTCAQNFWSPQHSRCSAKEEEDDKSQAQAMDSSGTGALGGAGASRRGRPQTGEAAASTGSLAPSSGSKKVTQWVQCERKGCGKWRKVPAHIDVSKMSDDHWFCEKNYWDDERNSCEALEESDSEEMESPHGVDARTQLILSNSKGPGQLSYRRIIFGPDGRVKAQYAEKSKVGYGIFSYTDVPKPNANDNEDSAPPVVTKKVSYWASECYDESGADFTTVGKKRRIGLGSLEKKIEMERKLDVAQPENELLGRSAEAAVDRSHHLLDALRRLHNWEPPVCAHPILNKQRRTYQSMTMLERQHRDKNVVCGALLSLSGNNFVAINFRSVFDALQSMRFSDYKDEVCRGQMTEDTLKDILRSLEDAGEVEITENTSGQRFVLPTPSSTAVNATHPHLSTLQDVAYCQLKHLPPRMRKQKLLSGNGDASTREISSNGSSSDLVGQPSPPRLGRWPSANKAMHAI